MRAGSSRSREATAPRRRRQGGACRRSEDPWAFGDQISVYTITHDVAALAFLVSRMGARSVVLGTDLPFSMATRSRLDDLRRAVDAGTATMIPEENPSRLFGFHDVVQSRCPRRVTEARRPDAGQRIP